MGTSWTTTRAWGRRLPGRFGPASRPVAHMAGSSMSTYFVTVPTLTEEQREAVERSRWRVAADLRGDVAAAVVPTTTIEVRHDSPEEAAAAVADEFGVDPAELRVEEREAD